MNKYLRLLLAATLVLAAMASGVAAKQDGPTGPSSAELAEEAGFETASPSQLDLTPDAADRAQAIEMLNNGGVLLIPDSTNRRVMAFDPLTGNLVDANFIPADTVNLSTPINAILSAAGDTILVSDQIKDVVQEYDLDGNYLGVFAPAGGPNTAILDNIRGISLRPNGNLLVTVGSGANTNSVAEFDTAGNYLGNFIAAGAGGLASPFDVYGRAADWLVAGISGTTGLLRYDLNGSFLNVFAPFSSFPEQIDEAANGNVLVANFSPSSNEGVLEYTSTGVFVGRYDPPTLGGYRGAYELPNGNILTTTGTGVHEISRAGALVQTKISGVSARFIEFVLPSLLPRANADSAVSYGYHVFIDVLANDAGGTPPYVVHAIDTQPANGKALNYVSKVLYIPNRGWRGTDTFTYTVRDSDGNISQPGTVTVMVY